MGQSIPSFPATRVLPHGIILPQGESGSSSSQSSYDLPFLTPYLSGDAGYGTNYPCVGQPLSQFHTTGFDDVKGCALAIAYKSEARDVQPEDFTVFSVNHTCVWYLNTAFEVPDLPDCPPEGCVCAWFWIHSVRRTSVVSIPFFSGLFASCFAYH